MPSSVASMSLAVSPAIAPRLNLLRNAERHLEAQAALGRPVQVILDLMRQLGVGAHELAAAVGAGTAALLEWFRVPARMPLEVLADIADILGVAPEELF